MLFRPELAARVLDGSKTVTRRPVSDNPRSPHHPNRAERMVGRRIPVMRNFKEKARGHVIVSAARRETFRPDWISNDEAEREGFVNAPDFKDTWRALHGNLDPVEVYRYTLTQPTSPPEEGEVGGNE